MDLDLECLDTGISYDVFGTGNSPVLKKSSNACVLKDLECRCDLEVGGGCCFDGSAAKKYEAESAVPWGRETYD